MLHRSSTNILKHSQERWSRHDQWPYKQITHNVCMYKLGDKKEEVISRSVCDHTRCVICLWAHVCDYVIVVYNLKFEYPGEWSVVIASTHKWKIEYVILYVIYCNALASYVVNILRWTAKNKYINPLICWKKCFHKGRIK